MQHKYKIGQTVKVNGVSGTIFQVGYATPNSRNFTICEHGTEVADASLIGYHINLGRKVKIVKESDIT